MKRKYPWVNPESFEQLTLKEALDRGVSSTVWDGNIRFVSRPIVPAALKAYPPDHVVFLERKSHE